MDAQRKKIQNLTELLDEKRNELNDLYRRFGEKLLKDADGSDDLAVLLGRERVDSWKSLMDSRENDTRAILDIKDVLARKEELRQFHQEIEKKRSNIDGDYRSVLEELGYACYQRYTDGQSAQFAEIWEKASVDGTQLVKLEAKREKILDDLSSAGALQRMMLQLKLATTDSAITQHREKMMRILADGAQRLVDEGSLEKRLDAGELDEQFGRIMQTIRDTTGKRRDLDERRNTLQEEKERLKGALEKQGAAENPSRRIDALHAKIRDTDRRITMLSVMAARDFCDMAMNEEGEQTRGEDILAVTQNQPLEQVASLRSGIANTRKNIEILESELKIAALDRTLGNIDRSVSEFGKKIRQYQDQIEAMEKTREETILERNKLNDYRDSIRKSLK